MDMQAAIRLNLKLSGTEFKFTGFLHSGGDPIVKGWWKYKDGSEGGELYVDTILGEVDDFDGAYDLPLYVKGELAGLGIECSWDKA